MADPVAPVTAGIGDIDLQAQQEIPDRTGGAPEAAGVGAAPEGAGTAPGEAAPDGAGTAPGGAAPDGAATEGAGTAPDGAPSDGTDLLAGLLNAYQPAAAPNVGPRLNSFCLVEVEIENAAGAIERSYHQVYATEIAVVGRPGELRNRTMLADRMPTMVINSQLRTLLDGLSGNKILITIYMIYSPIQISKDVIRLGNLPHKVIGQNYGTQLRNFTEWVNIRPTDSECHAVVRQVPLVGISYQIPDLQSGSETTYLQEFCRFFNRTHRTPAWLRKFLWNAVRDSFTSPQPTIRYCAIKVDNNPNTSRLYQSLHEYREGRGGKLERLHEKQNGSAESFGLRYLQTIEPTNAYIYLNSCTRPFLELATQYINDHERSNLHIYYAHVENPAHEHLPERLTITQFDIGNEDSYETDPLFMLINNQIHEP